MKRGGVWCSRYDVQHFQRLAERAGVLLRRLAPALTGAASSDLLRASKAVCIVRRRQSRFAAFDDGHHRNPYQERPGETAGFSLDTLATLVEYFQIVKLSSIKWNF